MRYRGHLLHVITRFVECAPQLLVVVVALTCSFDAFYMNGSIKIDTQTDGRVTYTGAEAVSLLMEKVRSAAAAHATCHP